MKLSECYDYQAQRTQQAELMLVKVDKEQLEPPRCFFINEDQFKKLIEVVKKELPEWME